LALTLICVNCGNKFETKRDYKYVCDTCTDYFRISAEIIALKGDK